MQSFIDDENFIYNIIIIIYIIIYNNKYYNKYKKYTNFHIKIHNQK